MAVCLLVEQVTGVQFPATPSFVSLFFFKMIVTIQTSMGDQKPVLEIDGNDFADMAGFYREVSRVVLGNVDADWGRNLDAFNDILRGGFGSPPGGFRLVWKNSDKSRADLPRFDVIVEILEDHGPNGRQKEDGVEFDLV